MAAKKWYYGPSVSQNHLNVFGSTTEPTAETWGRLVKYAVGPFRTQKEAIHQAHISRAHPGWHVFLKLKGPYSIAVPKP